MFEGEKPSEQALNTFKKLSTGLEISKVPFDTSSVSSSRSLQSLCHSLFNSVQARSKHINDITKSLYKESFNKKNCPIDNVENVEKVEKVNASKYILNRISEIDLKTQKSQRNIGTNMQDVKPNYSMPKLHDCTESDALAKETTYIKNPNLKALSAPTSYSANSSPIKSINSLPSQNKQLSNNELHKAYSKSSPFERLRRKSSSIKELPLLSLINMPTTVFQTYKEKSSSMNDLNHK